MRFHRYLALAALTAIDLVVLLRLRPPAAGAPHPCPHPVAVRWRGRTQVLCNRVPRMRLADVAARLGVSGCRDRTVQAGEEIRLGQRCESASAPMPAMVRLTLGLPIDVNRASADELRALPGIGPVLAGRIVEHRRRHGPFPDVAALRRVRGIGSRTVERLGELISAGAAHLPAAPESLQSLSK